MVAPLLKARGPAWNLYTGYATVSQADGTVFHLTWASTFWASAMKFSWLATAAKAHLFSLATNWFVEPRNMFVNGVDSIKYRSKDSEEENVSIWLSSS